MHVVTRLFACSTILIVTLVSSTAGSLESDAVVAQVGTRAVRSSLLSSRLEALAPFQRQALGSTLVVQGKNYLEQILIPELLLAERGRITLAKDSPRIHAKEAGLLKQAFVTKLRERVVKDSPVTDVEVTKYYDAHPELFVMKERLRLQRLLVSTKSEAEALIATVKTLPSMDDFRKLAREKSLDKATAYRGGELGFVAEDGTTDVPELAVEPSLFAAAKHVKDGEVVATAVPEGARFAVLWRRGSRPAKVSPLARESAKIREYLLEARIEQRLTETLAQLRQRSLTDYRPQLLEGQDFGRILERGFADQRATPSASPTASNSPKQ